MNPIQPTFTKKRYVQIDGITRRQRSFLPVFTIENFAREMKRIAQVQIAKLPHRSGE
jgi:hypothetical protein